MKKLIIAAAIAAGALVSQAASFSWTTPKAYSITANTIAGGLAAGHYDSATSGNANTMYNEITSYGATWAYVITLTSESTENVIKGTLAAGDLASRAINKSGLSSTLIVQTDPETSVDYSIVITGTLKDGNGETWNLTSDAVAGTWDIPSSGDLTLNTAVPSGWTVAAPIPEPTSGLLMLLGFAGLALKRKRA